MFTVFGILGIGTQELLLVAFLVLLIALPAYLACRIAARAGFSAALGLITLIPFGLLVFLAILAFAKWPVFLPADNDDEATRA